MLGTPFFHCRATRLRDAHQAALIAAAARLGVQVEDRFDAWGMDAVIYRHGDREMLSVAGRINQGLSYTSAQIYIRKSVVRALLTELGLPVPLGLRLPADDLQPLARMLQRGPVVCKPEDGSGGIGVAMGLTSVPDVLEHVAKLGGACLVEEQVPGLDLRIQALGGVLEAACIREPASIIGDGSRTVGALVEARAREVAALNPDNRLEIDEDTRSLLDEQGLRLEDTPPAGMKIRLKRVANLSQGARAIDVTDELHPAYGQWVAEIGASLALDFFAVDLITADPARNPLETSARILEINAPCQWLAHTFSERRTHDLPARILRHFLGIEADAG